MIDLFLKDLLSTIPFSSKHFTAVYIEQVYCKFQPGNKTKKGFYFLFCRSGSLDLDSTRILFAFRQNYM